MKLRLVLNSQSSKIGKGKLARVVKDTCKQKGFDKDSEISVSIIDDQEMKQLNRQHLKRSGVTDVLSFPLDKEIGPDGMVRLGDVVICLSEAKRQAKRKGIETNEEVKALIKHGVLHLLGVHHQ